MLNLFAGNAIDILKTIKSESVNLVITSPPYYGLRRYSKDSKDEIGQEKSPQKYIDNLINVFAECKRVLTKDGSIWVNIADSYGTTSGGAVAHLRGDKRNYGQINYHDGIISSQQGKKGLMHKSLIGIPERFVLAMQDELGLIRRNTIIWHKPNCMPSSAKDRFTIDFEYFYFFTKSNKPLLWKHIWTGQKVYKKPKGVRAGIENVDWYYDPVDKRRKSLWESHCYKFNTQYEPMKYQYKTLEYNGQATKDYESNLAQNPSDSKRRILESYKKQVIRFGGNKYPDKLGGIYSGNEWIPRADLKRIKRTVWTITTKPFLKAHFATFPPDLVEIPILACTDYRDTVLDPFCGSGTVGLVASRHYRSFIGIDLSETYIDMVCDRIVNHK